MDAAPPPHPAGRGPTPCLSALGAAVLLALGAAATAGPAGAQEGCPDGRISFVFVDAHGIFDTDDLADNERFRWAYELANTLHVRTRDSFLEDELLFGVGDCYDAFLLEESERLLRGYPFIAYIDVYGVRQPDGDWHVVVDTKDEWTTKVTVSPDFEEGFQLGSLRILEENLLGRGILVGAFLVEDRERRDVGAEFYTNRLLGTRADLALAGGRTRTGGFFEQALEYPFVAEVGRFAGRQAYRRRELLFPYAVSDGAGFDHVVLPFQEEQIELTLAIRLGRPGNLTVFGLGISDQTLDFGDYPSTVEVTPDGDFGAREPASDSVAAVLAGQTAHAAATRLNFLLGQRNVRFVRRQGLDALRGIQDVPLGFDLALTIGKSVGNLDGGDDPDDLWTRVRVFAARAPGPLLLTTSLGFEGRNVLSGGDAGQGWRDLIAEADLLAYYQPGFLPNQTLFLRVEGAGGWDLDQPFQVTLGGKTGVRGLRRDAFPAARRLVSSIEHRSYVPWPVPHLFDLGFTVFADAGRAWAGDVPFGLDSGWQVAAGGGLRLAFPAGSRTTVRIDVAWPLSGGPEARGAVLQLYGAHKVGLSGARDDEQLARSRRVRVGPDSFVR